MSVSVDIPGQGYFDIKLTASSTAADIILLLRERLPDSPWHGNKLLSSGVCQLQCDDIVEATRHSTSLDKLLRDHQPGEKPAALFLFSIGNADHARSSAASGKSRLETKCQQVTKGSVSYLSSPCFSTIIGGIGGPARGKRRILDVMFRYQL